MRKRTSRVRGFLWAYLCVAVVVVFVWTSIFSLFGTVKDNQRLVVSVYNLDYDTQALKEEISEYLPELTDQKILEVYVDGMNLEPDSTYAKTLLSMQLLQTDIVVMPESLLKELDVPYFFPELPDTLTDFPDTPYYQINGKNYGIKVGCAALQNNFTKYCGTKENCYLLLSATSYNLGAIYKRGAPGDNAALAVTRYLLEVEGT